MSVDGRDCPRILINALSARLGGGQTYVLNLLRFVPEEMAVEVFILAPDSLPLPREGSNIKRIAVRWPVGNPFLRAAWEKIYLPRLLREIGADVLFCPGGLIGASLPPGRKSVTMFRNMLPFDLAQRKGYPIGYQRLRNWILSRVMRKNMAKADVVICLSEFARKVIEQSVPGLAGKTVVIAPGISPAFRTNHLPRPCWLPVEDYLLYASMIDYYKMQVQVVRAYGILKQKHGRSEKLVLAGPERRGYGRRVRAEIERLGLTGDVILAGPVPYEEMPGLYQHARINLFASECENCPNVLLEALAAGRPIVASNRPPMPQFAGNAAVYFDPASPEELAERVASLLEDPARMEELSGNAKKRSLPYDWIRTAEVTWKLIENLARDTKSAIH